ncbi:MAG: peptidoglycan-binding protein [Candidatus Peribacteria bacterium]|jgi:peptidoglycan hydrolase-like protein with peptidoglycan-binding domain|nr:peptidoglycan-binding protein [Candidatus Peribacteria bacterium]
MAVENFNSTENFKEIDRVKDQINQELQNLKKTTEQTLFHKNNGEKVEYDMDLVKEYLTSKQNKSYAELSKEKSSAWIMAVQIALESMDHDVGKIDGILGASTKKAVADFQ